MVVPKIPYLPIYLTFQLSRAVGRNWWPQRWTVRCPHWR